MRPNKYVLNIDLHLRVLGFPGYEYGFEPIETGFCVYLQNKGLSLCKFSHFFLISDRLDSLGRFKTVFRPAGLLGSIQSHKT